MDVEIFRQKLKLAEKNIFKKLQKQTLKLAENKRAHLLNEA